MAPGRPAGRLQAVAPHRPVRGSDVSARIGPRLPGVHQHVGRRIDHRQPDRRHDRHAHALLSVDSSDLNAARNDEPALTGRFIRRGRRSFMLHPRMLFHLRSCLPGIGVFAPACAE
ncbi:hypothetical protein BVI2075_180169 [Burkholderia vietnamiensis]|nr:hypothetical protein BVI2075_180169 [Burkholderia vietnamiensis]CAG9209341.1 hypothetical protein BVI1335_2020033 [Burkholderia vietnamiensis]